METADKVARPLLLTNSTSGIETGSKTTSGASNQPKEAKEDRLIALSSSTTSSSAQVKVSFESYRVYLNTQKIFLLFQKSTPVSNALTVRHAKTVPTPQWHAPWELSTVISGHLGAFLMPKVYGLVAVFFILFALCCAVLL